MQRLLHLRRITLGIRLGQAVQQICILRVNPYRPRKCLPRQLEVALGQGQFADRQQRLAVVGIGLQDSVIQILLDLLGISRAGLEQRTPDENDRVLIAHPPLAIEELHDDLQHLLGLFRLTIGLENEMEQPKRLGVVPIAVVLK